MSELPSKRPSAFLPAAGWIPWPGRSQVRLTGADRAKFLHNFCTNDIKKLQPGQGCEAFLTSIKGRILGHIFVFAGADNLVIDTLPGEDTRIHAHLDRYVITEDVQIEIVSDRCKCLYIFGPEAPARLRQVLKFDVSQLAPYGQHTEFVDSLRPAHLSVRRLDVCATRGYELALTAELIEQVADDLLWLGPDWPNSGAIAPSDFEAFRIDAGFPTYGTDLTDDHLAQEAARTAKAISFTKGCYLGQEPIARIDALGHVNRELRVVAFDHAEELAAPCKVLDLSTMAEMGTLSSVGRVRGSATVGLGMLRTSAKPGTPVIASTEQGEFTGQVVEPTIG